jgi:Asp-tRNA(Asn)/Glu-tRNA(Gln) amidotransferase A subunit family amidase
VDACGDVAMLRNMQINGEVTSVDIVTVFAQRCHTIGRKLNLVTEEYYYEALDEARAKDLQLARAIKEKKVQELGPLHGIPISIKDHVKSIVIILFLG